ncbi:MAG: 3-phosphoshikimate 1-carboxyvinyltransferase [Clostridiales Family XIII bacterium]|jgi:3-phosphoshikimate 1-carboxyvinyltransferase|nr:3-phosphoshikimate 1-carboxyvinyltransferase [Clostridiales Family XIII bacterium]
MRNTIARVINRFPEGLITPPASKSLSHRAVICAALAKGKSVIHNITLSEDIEATLGGVHTLGADWTLDGRTLYIEGGGERRADMINCIESASTLRFLIPVAALSERETIFKGKGRLLVRPMGAYDSVFKYAGVKFAHSLREIRVSGALKSGVYILPGDVSSQFISGLLFALPLVSGESEIHLESPLESRQYAEMTMDVMRSFGVTCEATEYAFRVSGDQHYKPSEYTVETDFSQAAYFLAAAALGCNVSCAGLSPDSKQGDIAILQILQKMGAKIKWDGGKLSVYAGKLNGVTVDARENPDLAPPVAALCCFCEGTSRIINAGRLRLKESDRLFALTQELSKLGADISETPDSLTIHGAPELPGGVTVDAHHDHRIAMAMALAAIRCKNEVKLVGWHNVNKSYPDFWEDFERTPLNNDNAQAAGGTA